MDTCAVDQTPESLDYYDAQPDAMQLLESEVKMQRCPTEVTWENATKDNIGIPMSLTQSTDREASGWAGHWAADIVMPECQWPTDFGPLPVMLELQLPKQVLGTFPDALGLGWDFLHPKALLRLSDVVLMAILRCLFIC